MKNTPLVVDNPIPNTEDHMCTIFFVANGWLVPSSVAELHSLRTLVGCLALTRLSGFEEGKREPRPLTRIWPEANTPLHQRTAQNRSWDNPPFHPCLVHPPNPSLPHGTLFLFDIQLLLLLSNT
jgi:hypothetical protein